MNTKRIIRNMSAYNRMLDSIKKEVAEEVKYYKVTECRNNTLYGGVECYTQYAVGAYTNRNGEVFSTEYANTVGTISSEGNFDEVEIPCISKEVALRAIRLAMKEAFSLPAFVSNDHQCPSDDDGMWWNNHRLVPSSTIVEVNDRRWIVYYQD